MNIKTEFIKTIDMNRVKINLLTEYFEELKKKHVIKLIKSKGNKKAANKLQGIQAMSDKMRDAVIKRYFDKCKARHTEQFFQWRRNMKELNQTVNIGFLFC